MSFGNGKTYVACQRAFVHLATFSNYGMAFARQKYKVLRATTMKTFLKICPKEFIHSHNEQDCYTVFINKSFIYWMHLDTVDEQDVRGLEINSALIDQGEEVEEGIANVLDARIGRWDGAKVPNYLLITKVLKEEVKKEILGYWNEKSKQDKVNELLFKYSNWPKDAFGERFLVPNYFDVLSNPSQEDEFHWIWRQYNPASPTRLKAGTVFHIERKTQDELNDPATIERILSRDQEFIDKYYLGKTGSPRALIHSVSDLSKIEPSKYEKEVFEDFIKTLIRQGILTRVLDHGEAGVTACGWEATINPRHFDKSFKSQAIHIFYREYYKHGGFISDHRHQIHELSSLGKLNYSSEEEYQNNIADPQIFKNSSQRLGIRFTVADEYSDDLEIHAPVLDWTPADNNEYATRNRINELLRPSEKYCHPITGVSPAPGIYFVMSDGDIYPSGCHYIVNQTKSQKRTLLGSIDGKNIYSEERDEKIVDHAYDLVRYDIAEHNVAKTELTKKVPKRSFAYFNALLKRNPNFIPAREARDH